MKRIGLLIILFISSAWVADDPFAALLKKLEEFSKKYPIEKVHLHLDKPYYAIGDDIWFKAYVTDSRTAEPTAISNVLYIELINDKDSITKQLKLSLQGGITWGDFKLTSPMKAGNYRIRAYTQWMRNAGSLFFFDKAVKIGKIAPIATTSKTIDIQFFPEGGSLVEGLPSKVAVKVVNPNGLGENISGKIVDNEGTEILDFETTYLGMGSFSLTPVSGKTYTAKVKLAKGVTTDIKLPKAQASGYVLAVNNTDSSKMLVKVLISEALCNSGSLNLLAQQNGNTVFTAQVPTAKQITSLTIPKKDLPSGIITLTLFSAENNPLAERIVFVNNVINKIDIQAQQLKASYSKRENVGFDILSTHHNKATQGSFSVAITNSSIISPDPVNETNILTSLLLTSDLIGYVESPNYYFLNNDISTRVQLDHLLLTQGWRKINWKVINGSQQPVFSYEAEKGLSISGLVTLEGKPVANEKVSLLSTSGGLFAIDTLTDADGRFGFDKLNFSESTSFTIQAKNKQNKKAFDITLDMLPQQAVNHLPADHNNTKVDESLKEESYFQEFARKDSLKAKNSLKQVEIIGEKKNRAPNSLNRNGPGVADAIFTADDLKNASALKMFLYGRVAGISLVNNQIYLSRTGIELPPPLRPSQISPIAIIVDGISVPSLDNVSIPDIESLEVLKSIGNTFVYGTNSGVIIITTKTAGSAQTNSLKEVEILAKANKAPNSSNLNGSGVADAVFGEEDLKNVLSLTHFLQGRVNGLQLYDGAFWLKKAGFGMVKPGGNPPVPMKVIVDGVNLGVEEDILNKDMKRPSIEDIPITDIESVEILKSVGTTFAYGTSDGVIIITTKAAKLGQARQSRSPGMLTISPKGYAATRQFYSPKYDINPDSRPDSRTTVYWNPHLVSDTNGKANINFFNTDQAGNYRIVIEGIDAFGNLARKTLTYEVK